MAASLQGASQPAYFQPGVFLPDCPASQILQTELGVPENWGDLSPTQQATHPANALIIQLAHAAWRDDLQTMSGCLGAMGIDINSMQLVNAKVQPYGGTMTAAVMRAGSKAVFVSFRCGRQVQDSWLGMQDALAH